MGSMWRRDGFLYASTLKVETGWCLLNHQIQSADNSSSLVMTINLATGVDKSFSFFKKFCCSLVCMIILQNEVQRYF